MDRLDSLLVKKGLVNSRTRGEYEIKNGNVIVDGKVITKPSTKVSEDIEIVINNKFDYVSKGALKLLKAIIKKDIRLYKTKQGYFISINNFKNSNTKKENNILIHI